VFKKLVIGIVLILLVLVSGCIQEIQVQQEIRVYPGSQEIDIDTTIISQYLNIPESEINNAISDLNIKTYGINGVSKNTILSWYVNQHLDWHLQKSENTNIFSLRAWSQWFTGHVVSVSDYRILRNLVGYDVVFITSSAPLTVYAEYLDYL